MISMFVFASSEALLDVLILLTAEAESLLLCIALKTDLTYKTVLDEPSRFLFDIL